MFKREKYDLEEKVLSLEVKDKNWVDSIFYRRSFPVTENIIIPACSMQRLWNIYEQIKLSYFRPNWTTDCERFPFNWIRKYESKIFKRLCTYILKNTLTGYDDFVIGKRTPTNKCSYSDEWKVLSILEKYFYIKTICFFLNLYELSWIFITDNI